MQTTSSLGVIECFFGPEWPMAVRYDYASFLRSIGFDFYIYAPKADAHLRKAWLDPWPAEYVERLRALSAHYRKNQVQFGVGLSPFGLNGGLTEEKEAVLRTKIRQLSEVGIDLLAVMFDDMNAFEGLAEVQLKAMDVIKSETKAKLVFCPSYYTFDPILDRVFGQRPPNYLEDIATGLSPDIEIFWTGEKVISKEISSAHLEEVARILKRKPSICDNFFANDGPKNCKFLKLSPLEGRSREVFTKAHLWAFNPMNEPELSKLLLAASAKYIRGETDRESSLAAAATSLCSEGFRNFLSENQTRFRDVGLDQLTDQERQSALKVLTRFAEPLAQETADWLNGKYNVGSECLTD